MSADSGVSASNLAGTTHGSEAPSNPPKPITEADYLQQQADDAVRAMLSVAKQIGQELGQNVDPRALTRSHPWISLGVAAVGGFLAVNLVPKAEAREARRLHHRKDAHRRNRRRHIIRELRDAGIIGPEVQKKVGILHRMVDELITVLRQTVLSFVMNAVGGNGDNNRPSDPSQPPPPATAESPASESSPDPQPGL